MKSESHEIKLYVFIIYLIMSMFILISVSEASDFPGGWETMEIEAKWDTTDTIFNAIISAFPDGGQKYGYDLNVRWSARPRKYFDKYYDNSADVLFSNLHMIRHRTRYSTNDSIAITDSFSSLNSANWSLNWQKVQYKSTPTRLASVWFRNEQGDADLSSSQVTQALAGNPPSPYGPGDNPVALLLTDHPGFDFSALSVALEVVQFRYRIELLDPVSGAPMYEISLDKIISTPAGSPSVNSYGVELEALRNGSHAVEDVEELFRLAHIMESEFGLIRATGSKGGIEVADSAEPVMRLQETVLDYREVELGFSFTKAIIAHNDGYAPLQLTVTNMFDGDPVTDHWSDINTGSATVNPFAEPAVFRQVYNPNEIEVIHTFIMRVTGGGQTRDVTLTGKGISPVPIDSVLVLDRSGSMSAAAGELFKIDALQTAANLYIDLLRPEIPGSSTGDKIGFVRYNHASDIYLDLNYVDDPSDPPSHSEKARGKLSDSAIADTLRLAPDGFTGIGGAIETAAGMLVGSPADRKHVMVVLTDGHENREPWIRNVIGPVRTANPALMMYSVGLGSNIEPDKLQDITNMGLEGYHQVADDLSGTSIFDLETFYFKIFSNATGMDLVVDPTHPVLLSGTSPIPVDTARIISSDRSATFLVLENPALRVFYDLEFVDPKGNVIVPGSTVGGIPVHKLQRYNYTIYRVIFPAVEDSSEYTGDWKLRLTPNGKWNPGEVKEVLARQKIAARGYIDPYKGLVPIGFAAAVASNYKLKVQVLPSNYLPGADVTLTASLSDRGWPSVNGKVEVDVETPGGATYIGILLYDDGTHGDAAGNDGTWTNNFIQTGERGSYKFFFHSIGKNERGEMAPREATRYVTLMHPSKDPAPTVKPCISCKMEKLLWFLMIALLLIIFYYCFLRERLKI